MIIAPDNRHISWTTLFSNYSAVVFTGELERTKDGYQTGKSWIVSTVEPFPDDPEHEDGAIPQPVRGGEVKQFVHGGDGYLGTNLNTGDEWKFGSPLSWHPSSTRAMWMEGRRGERSTQHRRMQVVHLPDYRPGPAVAATETPDDMAYAQTDLSVVREYARKSTDIDVRVCGKRSGHIIYRRTPAGRIDKTYANFSDDGVRVYSGQETMHNNPRGNSTYTADATLDGPEPGRMDLQVTFGPAKDFYNPTKILFTPDDSGSLLSCGFAEYDDRRLDVADLVP